MTNLDKLKNRDYVILVDKSGSMEGNDTPSGQTRWDYAKESVVAIAKKCGEYDPDGITLAMFAGSFKIYENTTTEKVKDVFTENSPMGSTVLAPPLKAIFDSYKARKKAGQAKANGEILLVITDGQPSDESAVAKTIIEFGNSLDNADDEYGISFFQVGKDPEATKFLKKLDDDLTKLGAKHDIVDTKTIDEVEAVGLNEALVAALED